MGNTSTRKAKGRGVQGKGKTIGLKRGEDGPTLGLNFPSYQRLPLLFPPWKNV
jgi:hypothetical protein